MKNWAHVHVVVNHLPIFAMGFAALFLAIALTGADRTAWMRAAIVLLTISFVGVVAAFFTGEPALEVIAGRPRTSGKALEAHHVASVFAIIMAGLTLVVTTVAIVLHRRRGQYPRWSVIALLATALVTAVGLGWTGLAGGRINHPELQEAGDLDSGPAHPH
jgi:uncharacterized membrane protein